MSIGVPSFFVDDFDLEQMVVQKAVNSGVLCSVSTGNSSFMSSGYLYDEKTEEPIIHSDIVDVGTISAPSIVEDVVAVALIENTNMRYPLLEVKRSDDSVIKTPYIESSLISGVETFKDEWLEYEYVGLGRHEDFSEKDVSGKVALIKRGEITFKEKVQNAELRGATGVIIFNYEGSDEIIEMGELEKANIPAFFIGNSHGNILANEECSIRMTNEVIEFENFSKGNISEFSSWGPTPNLELKPEITVPGGQIYSTINNDKYCTLSGTSMAAPHVSGAMALLANKLDNKAKVNLKEIDDNVTFTLVLENFGDEDVEYELSGQVNTDYAKDGIKDMDSSRINVKVDNELIPLEPIFNLNDNKIIVKAKSKAEIDVSFNLADAYLESGKRIYEEFKNGAFIEGFIILNDTKDTNAQLSVPFMGFYGEWDQAPILDGTIYEDDPNSSYYKRSRFRDGMFIPLGESFDEEYNLKDVTAGYVVNRVGDVMSYSYVAPELSFLRR